MFTNYLVVAFRNLVKYKTFSFINIAGLGTGLACVIVILAYVRLELSYDQFHHEPENIYRIISNERMAEHTAYSAIPLAPLLNENLGGLKKVVRIFPHSGLVSSNRKDKFREANFCYADSAFFEVFNFRALDGSLSDALYKPMQVVLTKSSALKYFGTVLATGKELFFEDNGGMNSYEVVAVIDDMPENSHFDIPFIVSLVSLRQVWPNIFRAEKSWFWPPIYTYVQMTEGATLANIDAQLNKITTTHLPPYVDDRSFSAQKLTDIHLHSNLQNEWQANSNYMYVRIFTTIAFFILLLACINYMNLATSKSLQRAGEVGIRKAMGSYRGQLVKMFLGESLLTTGFSIIVGLAFAQISMSLLFNPLLHKTLSIDFFVEGMNLLYLLMGWIAVSALAGLYPALYLSSFSTIRALKGKGERSGSVLGLRKGLVVFQFFISALLLVGTFVVIRQVRFIQSKDLGYSRERILTIPLNDYQDRKQAVAFKDRLLTQSGVQSATLSSTLPYGDNFFDWEILPEGRTEVVVTRTINGDEDFLKTYNMALIDGRDFSKEIPTDKEEGFIINEALARKLDWKEPVGKELQLTFYTDGPNVRNGRVIGVVKDFHFQSLYSSIEPLLIFVSTHPYFTNFVSVRLNPGSINDQIAALRREWSAFSPESPFEFSFLDNDLNKMYVAEQTTSRLLSIFTGLSIVISCLGLFGLTAFSVQQRTKEIGVRKVLGASEFSIMQLISKEFVWLVVGANLLAWPLAWYAAAQWLSKFAYHISVEVVVFAASLGLILLITFITVGYQSLKAALANPVKSLRSE